MPSARFTKSGIYFDKVVAGTEVMGKIDIANKGDPESKWKIVEVHTSSPIITAKYLSNRSEILCKLSKDAPIGLINEKVTVMIKDPNGISPTEIPVSGKVVGPFELTTDDLIASYQAMNQNQTVWKIILDFSPILHKGILKGKMILRTDDSYVTKIEVPFTGLFAN